MTKSKRKRHINRISKKIIDYFCDLIRKETVNNLLTCIGDGKCSKNDFVYKIGNNDKEKKPAFSEDFPKNSDNVTIIPPSTEQSILCFYFRNNLLCEKMSEIWIFVRLTFDESDKICVLNIFYPYDVNFD